MYIEEVGISIRQREIGVIDSEWMYADYRANGTRYVLYFRIVELSIDLPCCNRRIPRGDHRCILPPGHESADIFCFGYLRDKDEFRRITHVTDRHPHLEMGQHAEEESTTDA